MVALQTLRNGELFKFCNFGIQGQLKTGLELVNAVVQDRRPQFITNPTPFLVLVQNSIQHFARYDSESGEITGKDAVIAKTHDLQSKLDTVTVEAWQKLDVFRYLLSGDEAKALDTIKKSALDNSKKTESNSCRWSCCSRKEKGGR